MTKNNLKVSYANPSLLASHGQPYLHHVAFVIAWIELINLATNYQTF